MQMHVYACPKDACLRWAMQLLPVMVQRGNTEMYRRSGLIISREQAAGISLTYRFNSQEFPSLRAEHSSNAITDDHHGYIVDMRY